MYKFIFETGKKNAGSVILGIHIEGVFITKYGVHDKQYVREDLTIQSVKPFLKENVILFTLAPELDKSGETINFLQENKILVSIGHSNASYREGVRAIEQHGLRTVTHMFNSLRGIEGFSHRENGVNNIQVIKLKIEDEKNIDPDTDGIMLAVLKDPKVLCMLIADGVHVDKEVVKLLKQYKSNKCFSLASDSISEEFYEKSKSKGTLGGSQISLDRCVSNLIKWKVASVEESLIFASLPIANQLSPASSLGLGKVSLGQKANIVIWDTKKNAVKGTIIGQDIFFNY